MKKHLFIILFQIFVTQVISVKSQETTLNPFNINEWISNRKPLFLTGTSKSPAFGNIIPASFEVLNSRIDDYKSDEIKGLRTASSVALIYKGELNMAPLDMRISIYPLSIVNDTLIVCTRKPKPGNNYFNLASYDVNDLVIFSINAIELGEVSEIPVEMTYDFLKRFYYSIRNVAEIPDVTSLKCLILDEMKKYEWVDEFVKQDYFNKFQKIYGELLPIRSTMVNPSPMEPFYLDYAVKIEDYSFEKKAFSIKFGKITNTSPSFYAYPCKIEISLNQKTISGEPLGVEEITFNHSSNDLNEDTDDGYFNDSWGNESYFYMSPEQARNLVNSLNEKRVIKLRLIVTPRKYQLTKLKPLCDDNGNIISIIPFEFLRYEIVK